MLFQSENQISYGFLYIASSSSSLNSSAPRSFDSASRRRHLERSQEIFLALRSVSHRHCREATPWCCTHPLFIGLHGRFLAYARNDDTGVRGLLVTSHKFLAIRPCFQIFWVAISRIVIPSAAERSFLHCGQYHIGTVRKRRLGTTHILCLSVCKEDFSLTLEMTMRESSSH